MKKLGAWLAHSLRPGKWDTLRLVNATELTWIVKLCVLVAWRLCLWSKFRGSARSAEAHAYDPPTWLKRRGDPNEDRVIAISRQELELIELVPHPPDGVTFRIAKLVRVAEKGDPKVPEKDDEKEVGKDEDDTKESPPRTEETTEYDVTLRRLFCETGLALGVCGFVLLAGYVYVLLPWTVAGVETLQGNLPSYLAVATGAWAALLGLVFAAGAAMAAANPELLTASTAGPEDRSDFSRRLPTLLYVLLAATSAHGVSLLLQSPGGLYLKLVGPLLLALSLFALWLLLCAFVSLASLFGKPRPKSS